MRQIEAGASLSRTLSKGKKPKLSSPPLDVVLLRHLGNDFGRDNGLDEEVSRLELAEGYLVLNDVVAEHHAGLVSIDDGPFALVVAANDGKAVGIGVGCYDEVGIEFRAEFHAKGHGLSVLGIGADHGREVAVDDHLFGHDVNVLEAPAAQAKRHDDATRSMHGAVNNVEVFLAKDDVLVNHGFLDGSHVVEVHLAADNLDEVGVALEFHILDFNLVHLVDDARVVRREHLCAILPISLVAIVFLRVVAGRHVHTCLCAKLTDGEADLGRGTKALKEIDLDSVGREDVGNGFSEETAIVAAVVTDHNAESLLSWEGFQDVVRKALSSHADDILVHAIGSSAHNAAQTARSELQTLIKSIHEGCFVLILHHFADFRFGFCIIIRRIEPCLGLCFAIFNQLYVHN